MTGLNLHNLVADALEVLNPYQEFVFTKTTTQWEAGKRTPKVTTSTITLRGKMQPASLQELRETGFDLQAYQYYKLFISSDITQLDKVRQLGSDTFTCDGLRYRIVAKEDWFTSSGWRETYCYLDEQVEEENGE